MNDSITVISSKRKIFNLNLKELWKYRDLIFLFVKRDFVSKYKQTVLGPLWAIIQPLFTTLVFTVIFGNLARLTTMDSINQEGIVIPSFLFYMCGNICWAYFSGCLNSCGNTFIGNAGILGKVYFPRLVMPISVIFSQLINFIIQFTMLIIFIAYFIIAGTTDLKITVNIIMLPILVLQMGLLGMGFGIIVSALTTKYRDLVMLVGFAVSLWQYATPVAYGLCLIPEEWMGLYKLNPMTMIVTTFRYSLLGSGSMDWAYYGISWLVTVIVLAIGVLLFTRVEKTFMDTI